jgi:hypothetical protein
MWFLKKEHTINDLDLILLEVEIHSPCCRGKIFKYYLDKSGRIFNHQMIDVGEAAYDGIMKARKEYHAKT